MRGSLLAVGALLIALLPAPPLAAQADSAAAETHFQAQRWPEAVRTYQALTQRHASNGYYWLRYGQSLEGAGRWDEAVSALQRALQLGAQPNVVRFRLAKIHARRGNAADALTQLEEATKSGFAQLEMVRSDPDLATIRNDARYPSVLSRIEANRYPCKAHPAARQFDFLTGYWSMQMDGEEIGTNRFETLSGACIHVESPILPTLTGKGISYYDADTGNWRQIMVFDNGNIVDLVGGWRDGAMRFEGKLRNVNGNSQYRRVVFTPLEGDRVRETIEVSPDGRSWSLAFDATYVRKREEASTTEP
ncbi:MAG TPA: tetratricopeptide repeat protein [Longimicrobiaceae bacterium]|nr:tetratricopeptide repeat protein [Longimicrobiaceae bacterium]